MSPRHREYREQRAADIAEDEADLHIDYEQAAAENYSLDDFVQEHHPLTDFIDDETTA